jgi:hypothetical protein
MNILEAEDVVKGLPDQVLFQYAQNPPPQIPQYLAVSEVQRRQEMRQRFQSQQAAQQQPTVKDQILQGGIASAGGPPPGGEQPPMAPPGGAPPMAPPMGGGQPPVMAAAGGMMPYSMGNGGSVPAGQENPQVFREFMRRNFATPQGLAANIGLVGGALLGGPIGAGIGGNLGTYIGQKLTPTPPPLTDMAMQRILGGGLRVPEGGAVGGGRGGGLPYGGPTSYAGMYESPRKKPTVTVEEIPQPPQGMAVGGLVIPELGSAFESSQQSGYSQASAPPPGISRDAAIRRARSLMEQGRQMDALVLLRQAGVNPSEVGMYNGGMTPGGIVYMQEGRTVPSKDEVQRILSKPLYLRTPEEDAVLRSAGVPFQGARDLGSILRDSAQRRATPGFERYSPGPVPESGDFSYQNVTSSLNRGSLPVMELGARAPAAQAAEVASAPPEVPAGGIADAGNAMAADAAATGTTGGQRAPSSGGMPDYLRNLLKPQERSPEVQAAIDLNRQMAEQGLPAPIDLSQYVKSAQQRQQEAQAEARRMAIANTLMGLGTGLVAGDPAAGLQRATQMATETLREGRKEAQAEGRMAEQLQLQQAQQQRQAVLDAMKFRSESVNAIANLVSGEEKANRNDRLQAAQLVVMFQNNRDKIASDLQTAGMNRKDAERKATSEALNRATELVIKSYESRVSTEKLDPAKMADEVRAVQQQLLNSLDSPTKTDLKSSAGGNWGQLKVR